MSMSSTAVLLLACALPLAAADTAVSAPAPAALSSWMSWEGGVDLIAMTKPGLAGPNLILHVARMVHTPVGSAPSGLVLWQPDPAAAPVVAGFISTDPKVGAYFGPHIFAGTPFEQMPVLTAKVSVETSPTQARSVIEAGGHVFTVTLTNLAPISRVVREPGAFPFHQLGVESAASTVAVTIDGKPVEVIVPLPHPTGGPSAVYAQAGVYTR